MFPSSASDNLCVNRVNWHSSSFEKPHFSFKELVLSLRQKTRNALAGLLIIAIVAIAFFALVFVIPSPINITQGSVLAISDIEIAPQGYEGANGEWKGSFWTVLATTDMEESYNAIKFDSDTVEGHNTINGQTVNPDATLEIRVVPGQPYYARPLDKSSYNVYPETETCVIPKDLRSHSTSDEAKAGRLDASIYTWGQQSWTSHTPFTVQLFKNGQKVDEEKVDSVGSPQEIRLTNKNDNDEWVSITNIGQLATGYSISVPDIMMFSSSQIFRYNDNLLNDVKYKGSDNCYAYYWFGGGSNYKITTNPGNKYGPPLFADDGSPGGYLAYATPPYGLAYVPIADGNRPGWYRADTSSDYKAKPRAGNVFNTQSGYGHGGYSLVEYLSNVRGYSKVSSLNVWNKGFNIKNNIANINLPKGSLNSLITVQISTELADAIVYSPAVGDIKIDNLEWQGSGKVGDRDRLNIKLSQTADVEVPSTATVTIEDLNDNPLDMNPPSFSVTLGKGESTTEVSELLNTGAEEEVKGKLRVTCANRYGDSNSMEIEYTLLPKGVGSTTLTVHAINSKTQEPIAGLEIAISYSDVYTTRVTGTGGDTNGAFTIDLEGYQGSVSLSSAETSDYQAHSMTKEISLGPNDAYFKVDPIDYTPSPEFDWFTILLIAAIVIVVIMMVAMIYYALKKSKRRR